MGFAEVFVGHAGRHHHRRAPDQSCSTGGMYTSPTAGQTVDALQPVTFTWNPTCLDPDSGKVDIYLYAPSAPQTRLHMWKNVPVALGKYSTELKPKWWNSTPTIGLQLSIVEAGTPDFMAELPAGPLFTATYTAPANGKTPDSADTSKPESGITRVGGSLSGHRLSGGRAAAAVLLPLIAILALGVAYWIRMSRIRGQQKRKRWSEAIDKRMSTISTDWKSVTPGGAKEAIRQSMAVSYGSNRMSGFAFGNIRPQSTASDVGQAGIGARGMYQHNNKSSDALSQLRPGLHASAFSSTERISRVSFANDPRPRSRYNEKSVYGDIPVPPLPKPLSLSAEDIRNRMDGSEEKRNSMDEVMPALSMMRTGGSNPTGNENDDYLLWNDSSNQPQPPIPAQTHDRSPVGMMPMQAMPANVMSPDDMLRAYAARSPTTNGPVYPQPAATFSSKYTPAGPKGANLMGGIGLGGKKRQSVSRYNEDDAYIGTAS